MDILYFVVSHKAFSLFRTDPHNNPGTGTTGTTRDFLAFYCNTFFMRF